MAPKESTARQSTRIDQIKARLELAKRAYDALPVSQGVDYLALFNALKDAEWLIAEIQRLRQGQLETRGGYMREEGE